ncbi:MAG: DEAD/DEAH box helicase [Planctomycetaceae bacterium]
MNVMNTELEVETPETEVEIPVDDETLEVSSDTNPVTAVEQAAPQNDTADEFHAGTTEERATAACSGSLPESDGSAPPAVKSSPGKHEAVDGKAAFFDLDLSPPIQEAVRAGGYVSPTPIQAQAIPVLLEGRDVLGQASTGTGKTAAFALPLLSRLDPADRSTQVLVLTPTRELALQVAKSFRTYGHNLPDLTIQPIYGGASYFHQIKALERGVQIVVGTPGRLMDHMRRGTLKLDRLRCIVLDEADEMLRMGFVDDVTWILEQTPSERQTALFSATMPPPIQRIAEQHLRNPAKITIREATTTATTVQARYVVCAHRDKPDVLHRILETENTDGVLIFVRTKEATLRIAETLASHGFNAEALNGDMPQAQRERTVQQLKNGRLNVVVATDVAARGLDVQRISHVINFDVPHDTESYVHRIGRTGRAGRSGDTILFVTRGEIRRVRQLERETRQRMDEMEIPAAAMVNRKRRADFLHRMLSTLENRNLTAYQQLVAELQQKSARSSEDIAVALLAMLQGDRPFLMDERHDFANHQRPSNRSRNRRDDRRPEPRPQHADRSEQTRRSPPVTTVHQEPGRRETVADQPRAVDRKISAPAANSRHSASNHAASAETEGRSRSSDADRRPPTRTTRRSEQRHEPGMERFRIEVGREHGVEPGNIVGAIANEAGLAAKDIGRITIEDDHSFVDLPEGMPRQIFRQLKDVIVSGRHLRITRTQPYKPPFQKKRTTGSGTPKPRRQTGKRTKGHKPARHRSS